MLTRMRLEATGETDEEVIAELIEAKFSVFRILGWNELEWIDDDIESLSAKQGYWGRLTIKRKKGGSIA